MDGEKYLIKIVKLNPAIWNKKLFDYSDNELKNIIWLKIARKFNMDVAFLRKRWCHLRERFVKDLRLVSTGQIKKSKYKHFNDMMFLAEFIKFREKNSFIYNDVSKKLQETSENEDDQITFDEITYLDESNEQKSEDIKSPEKLMEFDELIMKIETDDDPEELFVELSESCEEEEIFDVKLPVSNHQSSLSMPSPKEVKVKSENIKLSIDEPSCSKSCSGDHKRDEDFIFGELVTSILSKMEDEEKRKMKKAIMNILL